MRLSYDQLDELLDDEHYNAESELSRGSISRKEIRAKSTKSRRYDDREVSINHLGKH